MQARGKPKVIMCRILMPLPKDYQSYHAKLSASHLDLEFFIVDRMEVHGNRLLEDIKVTGRAIPPTLVDEIRTAKGVLSVETLDEAPDSLSCRVMLAMSPLSKILKDLEVIVRYPVPFGGSAGKLLVVAPHNIVRTLLERLQEVAPDTFVEAVHTDPVEGSRNLLTTKQLQIFKLAMSVGYWDIPRKVTLADLAGLANVAKSTLSETLATIEKKLLYEVRDSELTRLDIRAMLV